MGPFMEWDSIENLLGLAAFYWPLSESSGSSWQGGTGIIKGGNTRATSKGARANLGGLHASMMSRVLLSYKRQERHGVACTTSHRTR